MPSFGMLLRAAYASGASGVPTYPNMIYCAHNEKNFVGNYLSTIMSGIIASPLSPSNSDSKKILPNVQPAPEHQRHDAEQVGDPSQ